MCFISQSLTDLFLNVCPIAEPIKEHCDYNWQGPVVIVPTKYYTVPTDQFRDWGVSLVIWANHNMRAAIAAMQDVTQQIYKDQSLVNVEKKVGNVLFFCYMQSGRRIILNSKTNLSMNNANHKATVVLKAIKKFFFCFFAGCACKGGFPPSKR